MLAGHVTAPGKIELVDVPEPRLDADGQILFQPELGCLCGSDLPFFGGPGEWGGWPQKVGHSLHEMVGTVVASSGDRHRVGDRVLAVPVDQVGLFERFVVDETRAIPLDARQPPEHTVLAQPLGTVIFALKKLPHLLGKDVAVVGQGPIGQIYNAALRNLGARRIIGIDPLASRLEMSQRMGATHAICNHGGDAINHRETIERVEHITAGRMPDVVIEAVGHQDQALNLCIALCSAGGRLLYFGVPPQTIDKVRWRDLVFKSVTVHTSINPVFPDDFALAMQWIAEGRIDLSPLATHRYPLAEIQTAFETFRDKTDGAQKVLIDFPLGSS